jgi:hypothetical protein
MKFLLKTSETKKFGILFCVAFLILKNIFCLRHPGLIVIFIKRLFKFPSSED